jgi:hypothetical protein
MKRRYWSPKMRRQRRRLLAMLIAAPFVGVAMGAALSYLLNGSV